TPLTGWQVSWPLAAGQTLGTAWNARVAAAGSTARATPADWNATLAPGESTTFGYLGATPWPAATLLAPSCVATTS
ncbi:cellulose binding domain-containing protein, partial [Enterococcus faecium]